MRKSAVEKAGAWEPSKTTNRFPPAPTLPWKSRGKREIPTFPPRRLRLLLCPKEKQRQNPKPRRRRPDGRVALFHKADRSRINKTGQLDLLTTPAQCNKREPGDRGDRRWDRQAEACGACQRSVFDGNALDAIDDQHGERELPVFQFEAELILQRFGERRAGERFGGVGRWGACGGRPGQLECEGAGEIGLIEHGRIEIAR